MEFHSNIFHVVYLGSRKQSSGISVRCVSAWLLLMIFTLSVDFFCCYSFLWIFIIALFVKFISIQYKNWNHLSVAKRKRRRAENWLNSTIWPKGEFYTKIKKHICIKKLNSLLKLVFSDFRSLQSTHCDPTHLQHAFIGQCCLSFRFGKYVQAHCYLKDSEMSLLSYGCPEFLFLLQQLQHPSFSICVLLIVVSVGLGNLFLFCFFGTLGTESFERMADYLYESNWFEMPIRLQKNIIMMIQNAQKPIYYHGFGMAILQMGTFSNVNFCEKIS